MRHSSNSLGSRTLSDAFSVLPTPQPRKEAIF